MLSEKQSKKGLWAWLKWQSACVAIVRSCVQTTVWGRGRRERRRKRGGKIPKCSLLRVKAKTCVTISTS
jgi:hypothetical protein